MADGRPTDGDGGDDVSDDVDGGPMAVRIERTRWSSPERLMWSCESLDEASMMA